MGWEQTRNVVRRKGNAKPSVRGVSSGFMSDVSTFVESWKESKAFEIGSVLKATAESKGATKIQIKVPKSAITPGFTSDKAMMMSLGWYWEPLLYDLAFYEDMRDAIAIIDGEMQKFIDVCLDGFTLQCSDPEMQEDLEKALLRNPQVNFRETLRASMLDIFSLGNAYRIPIWKHDDKGRLVPKTFKPVRASAMRKLRDGDLCTEGYVQLLHRPSEFLFGATEPSIPTIWSTDQVLCGEMRTYGWYAYGRPLFSALPFVVRLKLTMERDIAEMLHQHVPRIDVTFTPEDQMTQEQVDAATDKTSNEVSGLKSTDNWVHTPDTTFEYKGPQGHALDASPYQAHVEDQLFYVLPFTGSMLGRDSQGNPFDSQQRWKIVCIIANAVRFCAETMYAPALDKMADDWGIDDGISMGWSQLDPESQQQLAEADEFTINNAVLQRDNGFTDQDQAARDATRNHPNGPVKKAAGPGAIPPPVDPNKIPPGGPTGKKAPSTKVRKMGPKTDGTKVPDKDQRKRGRRHAWLDEMEDEALSRL